MKKWSIVFIVAAFVIGFWRLATLSEPGISRAEATAAGAEQARKLQDARRKS